MHKGRPVNRRGEVLQYLLADLCVVSHNDHLAVCLDREIAVSMSGQISGQVSQGALPDNVIPDLGIARLR